jgi:hypothetical protein
LGYSTERAHPRLIEYVPIVDDADKTVLSWPWDAWDKRLGTR